VSYANRDELQARFGEAELVQLTDRTKSGQVDDAVLARALADADAEIDSYLAGRYALPLDTVPPVVVAAACDLARFRLYGIRAPEPVRQRYEDARAWLRDLAAGKALLNVPSPDANAATEDAGPTRGVAVAAPAAVFTASTFSRMVNP
jgi:phage gp36-like protein